MYKVFVVHRKVPIQYSHDPDFMLKYIFPWIYSLKYSFGSRFGEPGGRKTAVFV